MLRTLRSRRRPQYGTHLCAAVSAVLLLLSVTVLHSRLGSDRHQQQRRSHSTRPSKDLSSLLQDAVPETPSDDRIDELDVVDDSFSRSASSDEDEILRGAEMDDDGDESDQSRVSPRFYFDHIVGVIRRPFDRRSIDRWEDYASFDAGSGAEDLSKGAFGSDDVAVDEEVRRRVLEVSAIEDALLLKVNRKGNPLREGWGPWFDKKGDFLRRDRMFRSNLDLLNPQNNPMLQDPDGVGVTGLTRGDKLVQKLLMNEFKKVPFSVGTRKGSETNVDVERRRSEIKRAERRTLDDNASSTERSDDASSQHYNRNLGNSTNGSKVGQEQNAGSTEKLSDLSIGEGGKSGLLNSPIQKVQDTILANGNRWGYFPGLHPHLSFSEFMDAYFREGKCHMRVFMIWNSPSWMYLVRHQRGLESLLFHHQDACVVVFSETIELDFFKDFVKDGFKVAVAMPNLDELLKDTPTHIFSSVWFEWRKTKFYATHYSELVRLAALYKFGGIYLDADIILLKPLPSLNNSVGMEDQVAGVSLNGAVMAFRKHSPFIMECLTEFHSTYDDTRLRWNGADLLTRVSRNFLDKENIFKKHLELEVQPSVMFFPINSGNITRYFSSPATEGERAQQDVLFRRILNESFTFHFWNSLTYALAPERESLVARLIDRTCIHCFDVL